MIDDPRDMSTDTAWEEWARRDPYFGVITNPKFRRSVLDEAAKREFFESSKPYAHHVMAMVHMYVDSHFAPKKILDFGCGVGRLLVPFAGVAEEVVGVDVSPSMLVEARRNMDERHLRNVRLVRSDDALSALEGEQFDFVHSCLVLQHIPIARGRALFERLLALLRPGGAGAIHFTYSKTRFADTRGVAPPQPLSPSAPPGWRPAAGIAPPSGADPEMQMNPYNLNEIMFLLQCKGVRHLHLEFTDHAGELGTLLYFALNGTPSALGATQ